MSLLLFGLLFHLETGSGAHYVDQIDLGLTGVRGSLPLPLEWLSYF